ncbi:MAG TPA: SH3 domain-containing protein [Micropepsaceae bacterium]|jgi:SH3-like domain-containing protein|nr:SH3 domain-containing protein [Micropepsaceae bacterium]
MIRPMFVSAILLLTWASAPVRAAEDTKLPYFVSMKSETTNMREGPGNEYRIKWVYHRKGLPVEVIATYEVWRRVRDSDGEIGWVHVALLSRERSAVVRGKGEVPVRDAADAASKLVADAQPGAVGRLEHCEAQACEVKFDRAKGWIARVRLWGVHDGEQF